MSSCVLLCSTPSIRMETPTLIGVYIGAGDTISFFTARRTYAPAGQKGLGIWVSGYMDIHYPAVDGFPNSGSLIKQKKCYKLRSMLTRWKARVLPFHFLSINNKLTVFYATAAVNLPCHLQHFYDSIPPTVSHPIKKQNECIHK